MSAVDQVTNATQKAAMQASPWVKKLARLGYACKGAVYAIVGIIAIRAAFDMTSSAPDSDSALRSILMQPFGRLLLAIVGVGLFGYVLWRLVQAVTDPEDRGDDAKGLMHRAFYVVSGLIYGSIAIQALRMAIGGSSGGGQSTEQRASGLLAETWGVWLVGLVGAIIIGYGIRQLVKAWTSDISKQFKLGEVSARWRTWVIRLSRFGMGARGIVFLIMGWFLLKAAWTHDASEARGLAGALRTVEQTAYGPWLAAMLGAGVVAYGIFTFLKARYRRIETT